MAIVKSIIAGIVDVAVDILVVWALTYLACSCFGYSCSFRFALGVWWAKLLLGYRPMVCGRKRG